MVISKHSNCVKSRSQRTLQKDQGYGAVIVLVSIIVAVVYLVGFFAPFIGLPAGWEAWAVGIPVLLFVLLVLIIFGWIGWTMLTTPLPTELESAPSASMPSGTDREESENQQQP